ncbi:carboxylesterase family protein [Marinobacter pelagius]|uniref:carboxylesterase/lipase family protein n=1 Tax=Marinobacter sp. C7 TaxID=2951363 RepID=UPI001EEFF42A|nr:carboxylesterase family protein [Marinobacter sp. C7]MCG7201478.1 carboxylesterase family protein [Marinobacter sp. C7]
MRSESYSIESAPFVLINTNDGWVLGQNSMGVRTFKGIPYAAPPVGELRWRPPQPPKKWNGIRPALQFGPAPLQALPPSSSLIYRMNNHDAHALVMSEDCLYLNVWTPAESSGTNLPVLVWIHGGGNKSGHGGQDLFDGHYLATKGVVVVTINMRLGALGFFSHPELIEEDDLNASGNYGLQDVVAALRWVQANITNFGGDEKRVTLAGNSAGAASITHLMAAPAAKGLFQQAIGQSASGVFRPEGRMTDQLEASKAGAQSVSELGGCLDQLRKMDATHFLKIPPQGIIVDGRLLFEDTTGVFLEGRQADIPLMVGWNSDEGTLFNSPTAVEALRPSQSTPEQLAVLAGTYPAVFSENGIGAEREFVGDRKFVYPVWKWAETHAKTSTSQTWVYEFNHSLPLPSDIPSPADGQSHYGTFHTAELPYVWGNLWARRWDWTDQDHALAAQLSGAWVQFIKTGEPVLENAPKWPALDPSAPRQLMELGGSPKPKTVARLAAFKVFDEMYSR